MTNASAHVAWSLAVPAVGQALWGRKGLWVAGLSWMALTLVQESMFHAPAHPGPGYPAEVRADLITRLLPCATLLAVDVLRNGRPGAAQPEFPPQGSREPPRFGFDRSEPLPRAAFTAGDRPPPYRPEQDQAN